MNQAAPTISDSTEKTIQELQEKLIWERRLLRAIVDNLPSAVYAKDLEGRKILANAADCRNSGVESEEEILGKTDFDLFPRHIAEQFYQDDSRVLKHGESIIDREEILTHDNGDERWLRTSKIPIKDEDGNILGLVGFGHDITTEKQLEQENIIASEKIREQQDMVEQMIVELATIPEKISQLVNDIAYIARQTKMVAINAAIEAARVGEFGRGFEIVAREMAELSDRSSVATTHVREAIEDVDSLVQNILQLWEEVKM